MQGVCEKKISTGFTVYDLAAFFCTAFSPTVRFLLQNSASRRAEDCSEVAAHHYCL
jgi:hypothetical protein